MYRTANQKYHQIIRGFILVLCLCVLCTTVILGTHTLDSTTEWSNNHLFDQHHHTEWDEEILIFAFYVSLAASIPFIRLGASRYPICSIYPAPQLPPPK